MNFLFVILEMDEESLASTSSDSGTPSLDEMKRAREWFSNPMHRGKSIGPRERQWILNVFKIVYEKKLQERNITNAPDESLDTLVSIKKDSCKVACIKTVAEHLNLSKYYVSKILKGTGIIKNDNALDHNIKKVQYFLILRDACLLNIFIKTVIVQPILFS